ncbi:hypothetical protein [Microcoleus sp. FACHB-68]|uniref:hypothetical protein n=1 Tax=Microcoleus sp. FACHB-68 TaxID=2692826 RepID=UPI001687B0DA|nr:hypothetical protein [Microcoleus sp. FACHB-68]MBD1939099.1 hypothetical protein [Microcoleus sp. FACHB-68]
MRKKVPAESQSALFDLTPYIVERTGEYIPDSSWEKFDSLTPHETAVSESIDPTDDLVSESIAVSESNNGCISTYAPGGTARTKSEYYRYSWRENSRLHHLHVPGGNTGNAIAQQRAQKIKDAIASGMPAQEIISKLLKA